MGPFRAFRIHDEGGKPTARLERISLDDLAVGEVVIRVRYSDINYKDALAATGAGKILRKYPLVGGIDLAGEVVTSGTSTLRPGMPVLVTGCGLSETHDGGFAEYARVKAEWVIPVPDGLALRDTMALGTAGFTAALAIHRMEQNGLTPGSGDVIVTGATGGVGSLAIDMLSRRGYDVVALTGKRDSTEYLTQLGAKRILLRDELKFGSRPLEEGQWIGAVDNLGGDVLSWLIRTTAPWGNVASIGMASSAELKATVFPFILRGVNLLGINSVSTPRDVRLAVWQRLATDLKPAHLDRVITRVVKLDQLPDAFGAYLQAQVTGRTLVEID